MSDSYIPYGRQSISDDDVEAVVEVLRSDFLTQGPVVPAFEAAVAEACDAGYGVAVNSATGALHVACMALGLGPGDWLWTSPNTFVASANCALYCGAQVDFVDIDPRTYNLSVDALASKLEAAERDGRLPKIVMPVHFAGQPCDLQGIRSLADRYGFKVLADASHAIGARYREQPVGCGSYCDATVFSFHPVKIITSAEGGMVLTNDEALARRMRLLRSHGITRDAGLMSAPDGPWSYEQIALGYNYRMTDLAAALGLSQLDRLTGFLDRRTELVARYTRALDSLPLIRPWQCADGQSAWHLYVIQVDRARAPLGRGELFRHLREARVGVNVHYIPVHTQPFYRDLGFAAGSFPVAEDYYSNAITLPLYPGLKTEQQDRVIDLLNRHLH